MEEHEMLDAPDTALSKKNLWTTRFLIVSLVTIFLMFAISELDTAFGHSIRYIRYFVPILHMIASVSALAGLIMGFTEWKYNTKKALVGIICCSLILAFYILLAFVAYFFVLRLN